MRLGKLGIPVLLSFALVATGCVVSVGSSETTTTVKTNLRGKAEKRVEAPLDLRSGDTLVVEGAFGDIEVRVGPGRPRAACEVEALAKDDAEARRGIESVGLRTARDGPRVTLSLTSQAPSDPWSVGGSMDISVPAGTALELTTHSGRIRVVGPAGDVVAQTQFGDVVIEGAAGERIEARTSSGDIDVETPRSADVTLVAKFGDIDARGVFRRLAVETSSGDIEVEARRGSRAEREWSIETRFGDVDLDLPSGFACALVAETKFGEIDSRYPSGAQSASEGSPVRITATAGGSEVPVTVRTSSGDIDIH